MVPRLLPAALLIAACAAQPTPPDTDIPSSAPATSIPSSAPATSIPSSAPATSIPSSAPATSIPSRAPDTIAPDTDAPPTIAPPTNAPPTDVPPTNSPDTKAPDTLAPTQAPTTLAPDTLAPTQAPDTPKPATPQPVTRAPPNNFQDRAFLFTLTAEFSTYTPEELGQVLMQIIGTTFVQAIKFLFACRATACPSGDCPATNVDWAKAGCKTFWVPSAHTAASLAAETLYVGWDVVPADNVAANNARQAAYYAVQENLASSTPLLAVDSFATAGEPVLQITPSPAASEDDDLLDWKFWVLIVLAVLLVICCLAMVAMLVSKPASTAGPGKGADNQAVYNDGEKAVHDNGETGKGHEMWERKDAPVAGSIGGNQAYDPLNASKSEPRQQKKVDRRSPSASSSEKDYTYSGRYYDDKPSHSETPPQQPPSYGDNVYTPSPPSGMVQQWFPGELVDVLYGDDYFRAQVVEQQENGLYTVNWEDGTHSRDIMDEHIRRR
ncbi:hypothetical protein DIPPA_11493 [Diplonema papillatum]|nr:hypothetical protein DIPPA_11493 [Diplonema papillatum]